MSHDTELRDVAPNGDTLERRATVGGIALLLFAVAYFAWFGLGMVRMNLGFEDADNAAVMLAFFQQHPDIYTLSGLTFVLAGITLTVAVIAVAEIAASRTTSIALRPISAFGLFAAGLFFAAGVLRVQTPGTVLHMARQNPDWGAAAYLAVQMAGTQGFASAAGFALSLWAVGISLLSVRTAVFPAWLSVLGVVLATPLVLGLFGPLVEGLQSFYPVYIASIFGVMVWCSLFGIVLLRWDSPRG